MRRVSVVGTSGSGKSTLGRELAGILGVPYLELDSIHHQPGWTPLPAKDFKRRAGEAVAQDGWVIDGNYSSVQPLVWAHADTVAWLDLPKRTVMRRIVWRTLRRVAGRQELWNGNRERWLNFFTWDPAESVISWAWHKHAAYRERYAAARSDPANAHLNFVRLTSPAEVRRFLDEAREEADGRQADGRETGSGRQAGSGGQARGGGQAGGGRQAGSGGQATPPQAPKARR